MEQKVFQMRTVSIYINKNPPRHHDEVEICLILVNKKIHYLIKNMNSKKFNEIQ